MSVPDLSLGTIFSMLVLVKRVLDNTGLFSSRILELVSSVSEETFMDSSRGSFSLAFCNLLFSKEGQAH